LGYQFIRGPGNQGEGNQDSRVSGLRPLLLREGEAKRRGFGVTCSYCVAVTATAKQIPCPRVAGLNDPIDGRKIFIVGYINCRK